MILPIVAYGDPILKEVAQEIDASYPELNVLIENMFETMYEASGVGLAAPQIGLGIRLFIVDATRIADGDDDDDDEYTDEERAMLKTFKKAFINPIIIEEEGREWHFEEGCLSIPHIREDVFRKPKVVIEYYDENFELKEEVLDGIAARIVQHEYDHLEGVLFTDKLNPLKRRLLRKRLADISRGNLDVGYKMKFPLKGKK